MPQVSSPAIPGFRVEGLLGQGAFGSVYGAVEDATGRSVAIKWLPSSTQPVAGERFRREARAIAQLRHPNIVTLYSAGELGSIWGFLYQSGGNLGECLGLGRMAGSNAAAESHHSL